ncbi:MAG TPA: cyanophycin synthetase [Blastocatellia bacterium]|nr:cyanophycin synthetase [Blastocatellia bacterium]
MRVGEIRTLAGPNVYSFRPVLSMQLHLDELIEIESREIPGFNEQLLESLPGLAKHHCCMGRDGGFIERLREGTYFGHVVEHVALELTELAGVPVFHGKTRRAVEPGSYNIIIEYEAERGTKRLLRMAVEMVESVIRHAEGRHKGRAKGHGECGEPYPLEERLEEVRKLIARTELGPTTKAITGAATRRGIPWKRIGENSLVQLGYGKHRRFIQAAMTDRTSAVAVDIASDKELTKVLLREAGIEVPWGISAQSEAEAIEALEMIGAPVVIKPYNLSQGKGVSLNCATPAQVGQAYNIAKQYATRVVVERQLVGRDYRALVLNGKLAAVSERAPAHVTGDGERTISELVEAVNRHPARGDDHERPLTKIAIDPAMMEFMRRRGLTINYVPKRDEIVYLRECANLSTGGTAKDVTDLVHPRIAAICERAAQIIGLDICGIDLILDDISSPPGPDNGIVEVNAAPGLRMHVAPSEGRSRDVGAAVIDMMFPNGATGRIPIISITGTNGKTTITRMVAHALSEKGMIVGMATTDGIYIGGVEVLKGDTTGPRSAQTVLSDPSVEIAVLETARGGIVRGGLGYDWSDISVISNVRLDHLGQDGIETLDDLLYIKSLVAERVREGGTLILNADDERLAQLMEDAEVSRLEKNVVYFSMHPPHVLIRRHLATGGSAYLYKDGWIVEAAGAGETRVVRASDIPVTFGGAASFNIANALAAVAVCRAHGLSRDEVAKALKGFRGDLHNAGRAGLFEVRGGYALLDYGHNPDAFTAICQMAAKWKGRRVTGVIGVPGDRDNLVVEQAGRAAARGFERIIIKEDRDLRGRRKGEIADLLRRAVISEAPGRDCRIVLDEIAALRTAIDEIEQDDVIVIFYEKLDPALSLLKEIGATPAQSVPRLFHSAESFLQSATG